MVRRRTFLAALTAAALAGCVGNGAGNLRATDVSAGDRVIIRGKDKAPRVEVSSSRGIGEATLAVAGGNWPERVAVTLYLDGLEGFEASAAGRTGRVEFSSHDRAILASPPVSMISRPVRQADGFSLVLDTQALAFHDAVTLRWVDFYR